MTNWRERGYVPDSDGDESDFGQGQREGEEPGTAAAHTKSLELTFNGGPILRSEDNTNDPPLLFTQNRTFVADSDDEENQSLGADFEQEVPGVVNTVAQESQVGKDKAPALQLLDLSNEPDTDEDVAVQIAELSTKSVLPPTKHEIVSSSILEKGRLPGSPIGEASEPRTSPKNTQLAPSQESSPLSDPPSHLTTPTLSPISQRPRTSKFSVSIPPVSTEAYPATSISPTANDDFTSGPLRNLRQRKPIQLNPYLIEQARYRQTLKARGIKPIIIQPEEPEITAPADPEEDEYQTSGEEEDESQLQSRRQSAFVDSHSEEIRIQNAREQSDQALMDDDYDLPDVHELFRQVIREDTAAQGNGVKRRKLTHTYSRKATRSKPQKPIWKQPPILKHPTPATKPTDNRKARLLTPPPRNIDIFTILSDDSSPVRPSQRRPLSQRSVNTFSSGVVGSNNSDDEDTPPRSSIRSRARAVSIASDSSASSSESSNSSIDLRRLQKKTNGVLPASWWKLDQKRQASKKEKAKQAKKTSSSRNIQQPGIARAKLSRKPRAANENVFSLVDGSSTHETESDSDIPRIIPSASIARPSEPQLRQQSRSGVGGWLAFDDDIIMEDDRIDAMLQYSRPRKKQTTLNVTRRKRSRDHDEAGQLRGSGTCNTQSYGYGRSKVLNKRHAREGSPHTRSAIKPPPRLSVVDVYKHQKATSGTSPPQFLKIALRTASKRGRKARSGPERKLFCLETETDTKDVQDVLRGWREGTLDVIPYTRGLQEIPNDGARDITRYEDRDMGDPGGKPVNSPILERFEEPHRLRIENPVSKSLRKSRQTLLTGIVQRTSIPSVSAHKSARPTLPKPPSGRQTILKHPRPAPGQVETLSGEFYKRPVTIRRAATPLIDILRMQRPARPIAFNHPALGRFLEDSDLVVNPLTFLRNQKHKLATSSDSSLVPKVSGIPPSPPPPIPRIALRRVRRKNTPQRIDADTRERRQPAPEHVPVDDGTATGIIPTPVNETRLLTGLAPYGIKYSVNFDTHPLKSGTIFNSETFIGGGGLKRALHTLPAGKRAQLTRTLHFNFAEQSLHWDVYYDSIATTFENIMEKILDGLDKAFENHSHNDVDCQSLAVQAYAFHQACSNYLADILRFSDSVDFISFAERFTRILANCSLRISTAFANIAGKLDVALPATKLGLQTQCFLLLLTFQIHKISIGVTGDAIYSLQLENEIQEISKSLISRLMRCGIDAVRDCYEGQRIRSQFERGIGLESYVVEAWVMTIFILDHLSSPNMSFWRMLNTELHADDLGKVSDISIYERCWKTTFSLLPLFQFGSQGMVTQNAVHEHESIENWELLKRLASALFGHYKHNAARSTINDYCRIIYTRTHHLITRWGWRNPETMITTLFDFFATNMLPNLRNEPDHGSPVFLQNLDKQIPLAPEESDRCFHLLLKVIAVGLTSMKTTTSTKKIRDYVFRLMPNHRRQYPKEEVLRVEHLTALRNHHDLLCTLYWASPPSCRPPLSAIRGLVDPKSSHIQACAVSIRAWSYLIRFQLHTDEDLSLLVPLMEWYGDLTDKILAQHNSCRAEATRQLEIEREKGNLELSEVDLEDTIRRNQRQLEGFLLEAVRALGRVMINMKGKVASVMKLLTPAATGSLFRSFNKLSHKLVIEGLDVVMLYLTACQHTSALPPQTDSIPPEQSTEESQDYGDWAGMEDLVIQGERKAAAEQLITIVYEPLFRMVSSVLGADEHPADILLVKMIDTWARVDAYLVQQGLKSWHVYLETYGRESWAYFRDTVQTRKYTAYYMSKVIELSKEAYAGNKTIFLRYWFRTLVERKSMLKYQHEYTNAILNCDPGNAVLENLPFAKGETGIYNITLSEFENRRMSLISSVLANMRISYDISSPSMAPCLRREYTTMLQSMMDSMRENYVCLQTQWTTSNTTISSAAKNDDYVLFVQQVVELLQQHTIDIVPVDKFFTDSSAFPLPATDPTYVIGKLRNYGLKLSSPRAHKQLTAFFQTVCERAAVDGQQEYLVDQLIRALTGEQERGGKIGGDTPPTLRAFFLHTVFPAYMECAYLPDQAGWILATPIIRAATHIISRIQEDVDSCGLAGAKSVISSLSVWLKAALMALTPGVAASWELLSTIMSPNAHIGAWHVLYILTMESLIPSLSILDWLLENTSEVNEEENEAGQYARWQRGEVIEFATLLIKLIASLDEYMDLWNNDLGPEMYDAGTLRYICRQLARGSGDTEQILRNYNVNVEDELTSKELEAIKAEYLTAVTSSLKHEWHATTLSNTAPPRSDPEWFFTRRGDLRIVSHASTGWWRKMAAEWNSQVEGDEVAGADDGKGVRSRIREVTKEFLRHAARTEVWGRVVKSARESVWQGEFGRGQRTRRRAERVVQEEMAMLFC